MSSTIDELQPYFEKSSSVVRRAFQRVDQSYARPFVDVFACSFERRPVFTTFVVIFSLLSFVPILLFAVFAIFTFGAIFSFAICAAFAAFTLCVTVAGSGLVLTLLFLLFLASLLTASAISTFAFTRLVYLVQSSGPREGFSAWTQEVRNKLHSPPGAPSPDDGDEDDIAVDSKPEHTVNDNNNKAENGHISDTGSTVVVEGVPEGAKLNGIKVEPSE